MEELRLAYLPEANQKRYKFHILHGIALIYIGYALRALRWKIFLRPVRPEASIAD